MSTNTAAQDGAAAWQMKDGDTKLTVAPMPIPTPADHEIIVETRAIAINPVDGMRQRVGSKFFPNLVFPCIFGFDVAGTVYAVGKDVSRFRVGDRVLGLSCREADHPHSHKYEGAGFSSHAFVSQVLAAPIPDTMRFEDAAVLPMGLSVAATGLFHEEYLNLKLPELGTGRISSKDAASWVLITAGASSVGSCAIQLATQAGYRVVTTSSPANFDFVKSLGAEHALDYHRPQQEQIDELLSFFKGKSLVGALSIGNPADRDATVGIVCSEIVSRLPKPAGIARKFVALISKTPDKIPEGVETAFVWGTSLEYSHVGKAIFTDFVPAALASGQIRPSPQTLVVGHGLEAIQTALDRHHQGISARKVVVTL